MNVNDLDGMEGNIGDMPYHILKNVHAIFEQEIARRRAKGRIKDEPISYRREVLYTLYKSPNTDNVLVRKMEAKWEVGPW